MIATDHAPHTAEEKARGLKGSPFGIAGLETAFPILYTKLVRENVISLERLIELMSGNPKKRFGITDNAGYSVWDLSHISSINTADFLSNGKSTPFENETVYGKCILTVCNGKRVY